MNSTATEQQDDPRDVLTADILDRVEKYGLHGISYGKRVPVLLALIALARKQLSAEGESVPRELYEAELSSAHEAAGVLFKALGWKSGGLGAAAIEIVRRMEDLQSAEGQTNPAPQAVREAQPADTTPAIELNSGDMLAGGSDASSVVHRPKRQSDAAPAPAASHVATSDVTVPMIEAACEVLQELGEHSISGDDMRAALVAALRVAGAAQSAIDLGSMPDEALKALASDAVKEIHRRTPASVEPGVSYECCGVWRPCRLPNCVPERRTTESGAKDTPPDSGSKP